MSEHEKLRIDDIQGLVATGYGSLENGAYLLLRVENAAAACAWISGIAALITNASERPKKRALNIAFTFAGLQALGLDASAHETFPIELREGMTNAHRSRALGDHGESAPEHWRWGGPATPAVHILLIAFAADDDGLREFIGELRASMTRSGVSLLGDPLDTVFLRDTATNCVKEHFGFCDALAQPFVPGFSQSGKSDRAENTVSPGEFILGYPNEYGLYTELPTVGRDPHGLLPRTAASGGLPGLGINGSYLVFRQIEQHVQRFWRFMAEATKGNGQSSVDASIRLAAKMVGRWPSGTPLVVSPDVDDLKYSRENAFDYHVPDRLGHKCPVGSHVRRTNPRDSLQPGPGTERSVAINNRHRLLRRGRAYGPPVHPSLDPREMMGPEDGRERGLHFICVNGNLSRQFEFVQQSWTNNQKFAGLYEDADPLVGDHDPHHNGQLGTFTIQGTPVRQRICGIPRFVTTRGGAYFFLPGLKALAFLAGLHALAEPQAMVHAE
jgi:Dyp-type peroxidase family